MIHINLLPGKHGRVSKRTIELRNFLVLIAVGMGLVVLLGVSASVILSARAASLDAERARTEDEVTQLRAQLTKLTNYEKDKQAVEGKIAIIAKLKEDQGKPVVFVDRMIHSIPDRVWLTQLEEKAGIVKLTGRALTNSDIVELIRMIKEQNFLLQVQLIESRQVKEQDVPVYEFILTGQWIGRTAS